MVKMAEDGFEKVLEDAGNRYGTNKEEYQELLDIINVALMIGVRLNQSGYGRESSDS